MKALLVSAFALALLCPAAEAGPLHRFPTSTSNAHPVMVPLEEAATSCFAETVMANPKAMTLAKAGHWYEAAGVIGFLCRPEVSRMVAAHDSIYGRGTGDRFFKKAYARRLDKQLATRLQPVLETKAVASAGAPIEKAVMSSGGTVEADASTAGTH